MSPLRVFVVDPDEQRAAWLERLATTHGYDVERFTNGERAIDRFVQEPADAVLVEYVLPGRDGVATVEAIRWAPSGRDVRVVLLAREEPLTAPLQMLALRVDARAALVGPLDEATVQRALADLERDWDDEGTLALGDDSYAAHLHEARRRTAPPSQPPAPARPPLQDWLDVATVIAGAVRVETVEASFGDEPTTRNGDASVARAIGVAPDPPERPLATFDDVTRTEPGEAVSSAATVSQRPLDASDARAILAVSGGKIVGRVGPARAAPPSTSSRFAAPIPTSQFRAPSSAQVSLASRSASSRPPPARETPSTAAALAPPSHELAAAPPALVPPMEPAASPEDPAPLAAVEEHPRLATPSAVRRADVSTRQITAPREPATASPAARGSTLPDALDVATIQRVDPGTVDEARFVSARARETTRGDWSGSFATTPFPALLRRIADERASGGLVCTMPPPRQADPRALRGTVDKEPVTKVVYFRSGVPVHVRSNLLDECLGQLLLRKKRIGVATLEESIRKMRERGGLQGQILVEMGALAPLELGELLAEQVRQKLFDLFGWRRGEFRFAANMETPRDGIAIEMALPDMVFEGVCAAMPATLLLDIMTPRLDLFVVPDPVRLARFARVRVAKDLRAVLEGLDGTTPLRDVLRAGSRPGAIAQLLYALECLGAVSYETAAQPRRVMLAPLSLEQPLEREPAAPSDADDAAWDDVTNERVRERGDAISAPPRPAIVPSAPVVHGRPTTSEVAAMPSVSLSALVEVQSRSDEIGAAVTGPQRPQALQAARSLAAEAPSPVPADQTPALQGPAAPAARDDRALDVHVDRMFEAERCFRRGNRCLARGEHRDALSAFERAVELCPDEGEFVAYLGWARYCVDPASGRGTEAALRDLERARALAPDLHLTHLLHARVLDHSGRSAAALEAYREVLALEPAMDEALEAVARLGGVP
jgi:CheY-like chemotaxis protein/tetratricopeptide (TPR) repeat protein